jgi:chromosome segregation ATPase
MSEDKKPREFWITNDEDSVMSVLIAENEQLRKYDIHVIEYSAYQSLKEENYQVRCQRQEYKNKVDELEANLENSWSAHDKTKAELTTAEAKIKALEWVAKDNNLRTHDGLTEKIAEQERIISDLRTRILNYASISGKVAGMISGIATTEDYSHLQTCYELLMTIEQLKGDGK